MKNILLLLILMTAWPVQASEFDERSVQAGREFLIKLMLPESHLLPEFQGHNVIWLYHDNYLAYKLLEPTHPKESALIRKAIADLGVVRSGKIELLFGEGELPLRRYELRDVTKMGQFTVRSEFTTDALTKDFEKYCDLLCFYAIAEADMTKARDYFDHALAMWDGIGFNDQATKHAKIYATYKLALFIIAAKRFDYKSRELEQMRAQLFRMQAASGGWITDYRPDGTPVGFANVETTCMAIMALEDRRQSEPPK